jgi:hypothetical protein
MHVIHSNVANSNVVNMSFYRRQRAALPRYFTGTAQQHQLGSPVKDARRDGDYSARMKANAAIFIFMIFFVMSGVWLMDGISQSFVH